MKPCAATAAEYHNGEGSQRNPTCAFFVRVRIRRTQLLPPHSRSPPNSFFTAFPTVTSSKSVARSRWFEGTREREESWLARLLCSHYLIRSSGRVFCLVTCGGGGGGASERARASTGSVVGGAADGAGPVAAAPWFGRAEGATEAGDGILLAAVGSARGWSNLVRFCRRPPLPPVRQSVRPRVRAPASLRTHASTPLFLEVFFTYYSS